MKPSNNLNFRTPPSFPRFLSKRSIKAEGEINLGNFSRLHDNPQYDSDKKKRPDTRLQPEEDFLVHRKKDEGFNTLFGPGDIQRFKNENSWRERMSSNKNLWRFPESERKLGHLGTESQNMEYTGLPSFKNYLQRVQSVNPQPTNVNNYFSDRNLVRISSLNPLKNKKDNQFRLEMLDDSFLKKDKFRNLSMRMICKRDSDQFFNFSKDQPLVSSHIMNPIDSMKVIDEKFVGFSFKSRESVSQSKINEELRNKNFSPFPLSKINRHVGDRKDMMNNTNEEFLNNISTGAFKKIINKDPTTNAMTRSDIRIQKNSNILSPFEYNHQFGKNFGEKLKNQPIFLHDLNNKGINSNFFSKNILPDTSFLNLQKKPVFGNNFTSQRQIQGVYNPPKTNTMSWKHIKIPWSSKQIKTAMSHRRISMNFEPKGQLKDGFLLTNKDLNDSFIKSKRDLLGIETKYINQEGEDKSAIEENLNEKEDLSCEDQKNGGFEVFKNFENFKKIIEEKDGGERDRECVMQDKKEIFESGNSQNKTSLEKNRKRKKKEKKIHFFEKIEKQEDPEDMSGNKKNKAREIMKSTQNDSAEIQYNELKNEKEKMEKIKFDLDDSLQEFDNQREFADFHNLLGLLSCLFVTGRVEDRYLDLNSDEKSILIAIVYRKFKRTLNPE